MVNVGLKETLNPTKRVSIGRLGDSNFDGSKPCINIGDSDTGFIGSADGVLDIYANNVKVGYIDGAGLHMLTDITTSGGLQAGSSSYTNQGNINGTTWGGWLSNWLNNQFVTRDNNINLRATIAWVQQNFVRDVRMGANVSTVWGSNGGTCPPGYVLTGGDFNDNQEFPVYAPVQKNVNGTWYNVGRQ